MTVSLSEKSSFNMDVMNENECNKISEMVFQLTNKSYKNISEKKLSQLQGLCGESEMYIQRIYTLLLEFMKKPHSEIRYNAFYVFNEFFNMYRSFQNIAVQDLKTILDLCTDVNPDSLLPPPQAAAKELKRFFLISIKKWVDKFGNYYRKLQLMYEYLLRKKHVDFVTLEMEDRASIRRREEERLKKEKFEAEKLISLQNEINDEKLEISSVKESLEACIKMLVPTPEEFFIFDDVRNNDYIQDTSRIEEPEVAVTLTDDSSSMEIDANPAIFRETGMLKGNYSVQINLPKVQKVVTVIESEENAVIIDNAKDQFKLLNKKLERVKDWVKKLTILNGSSADLKIAIDLKNSLENSIKKYQRLVFEKPKLTAVEENCSSEDEEMEDVISELPTADEELIARLRNECDQQPSTSGVSQLTETDAPNLKKEERKQKLMKVAPKIPFDVDLYYWEEENLSTPMLHPVTAEGRNFWLATSADDTTEGIPVPDGAASLRTRTIEFVGKFEPVKWRCRFPLPNGKLCPRQDRFKCPFHGTIVARDQAGKCVDPEQAKKDQDLLERLTFSEAQDPELLAQIKMATGVDLKIPEKGKRKKKVHDSGFTNIKKGQDTVRKRLEKKLFKRSTVKRVAKTLDNLDHKRFTDKFGDHFQYVHETTLG